MNIDESIKKWNVVSGNGNEEIQAAVNFLDKEFGDRNTSLYWTTELLKWKVNNSNPAGSGIIFIANLNGQTVGSVTLTLKRLYFNAQIYTVAEIGDTYTHSALLGKSSRNKYLCNSEYSGSYQTNKYIKGSIFGRLVAESVDWARSAGVKAIYGTPNKNSCAGYVKWLNFDLVNSSRGLVRMRLIVTSKLLQTRNWMPKPFAKICGHLLFSCSQTLLFFPTLNLVKFQLIELVEPAGIEFDELWNSSLKKYASLVKDKNWLIWRYQNQPEVNYRIFTLRSNGKLYGWIVLKVHQSESGETITICDWLYRVDSTLWIAFMFKVLRLLNYQEKIVKLWSCNNTLFQKKLWYLFGISVKDISIILKPLSKDENLFKNIDFFEEFSIGNSDNV